MFSKSPALRHVLPELEVLPKKIKAQEAFKTCMM
jgi:hypothetical protein